MKTIQQYVREELERASKRKLITSKKELEENYNISFENILRAVNDADWILCGNYGYDECLQSWNQLRHETKNSNITARLFQLVMRAEFNCSSSLANRIYNTFNNEQKEELNSMLAELIEHIKEDLISDESRYIQFINELKMIGITSSYRLFY